MFPSYSVVISFKPLWCLFLSTPTLINFRVNLGTIIHGINASVAVDRSMEGWKWRINEGYSDESHHGCASRRGNAPEARSRIVCGGRRNTGRDEDIPERNDLRRRHKDP